MGQFALLKIPLWFSRNTRKINVAQAFLTLHQPPGRLSHCYVSPDNPFVDSCHVNAIDWCKVSAIGLINEKLRAANTRSNLAQTPALRDAFSIEVPLYLNPFRSKLI